LPPLRKDLLNIDERYEVPWYFQLGESLRIGMRDLVTGMLGAPFKTYVRWHRPYVIRRYERAHAYAVDNGLGFDYGAKQSIREKACGRQLHHYFLARDHIMYLVLAQQTLSDAVADFLSGHEIDLGEFDKQADIIINDIRKTYNNISVNESTGVVIGNNSKASVGDQPKGDK
jgi:hypothetical protein